MRTRMEVANSDFVRHLAACAARRVVEPITIAAADGRESTDQAKQRAIAYYISGFHRDEIESVLEDVGFTDEDIEAAMDSLAEYAKATSEEGPFALLEFGQLVKLNKAGSSGVLVDKRKDFIELQMDDMAVCVGENDIDFRSTAALTQAFQMRREALEKIKRIAEINYTVEDAQEQQSELEHSLETADREMLDLVHEIKENANKAAVEIDHDVSAHIMRFVDRLAALRRMGKSTPEVLAWVNTQPAAIKAKILNARKGMKTGNFRAVQEYFYSWENEIRPEFAQQLQQADKFIARDAAVKEAARAQTAVAAVLKRYK